jgi:uncharacterized membrane protein
MSQQKASPAGERIEPTRWLWTLLVLGLGIGAHALSMQTLLEDPSLASSVMSSGLWQQLVRSLGGTVVAADGAATARLELTSILIPELAFAVAAWLTCGWCIAHWRRTSFATTLCDWGRYGWLWWFLPCVWEFLRLTAFWLDSTTLATFLIATAAMWQAMMIAGWITTGCWLAGNQRLEVRGQSSEVSGQWSVVSGQSLAPQSADHDPRSPIHHSPRTFPLPRTVWLAMAAYFVTFAAMNVGLWNSLLIPHGDSAMYEEHLWNLLHGKGFRSYLDNGRLFLGEHIQVIHLVLIPIYVLWPSHVLLELCQSLALALGAIPVFRLAERHTGSRRAGTLLAIAYLLYFPMQFLDIAIDLKTFRPNSFEIPFLLFALDALERGRTRSFLAWLCLMLLCQEDAAPVIAPLGVWIAVRGRGWRSEDGASRSSLLPPPSSDRMLGWGLAAFGVIYTILVIKLVLPYFRGGADVHFAQYFADLGGSSGEIVRKAFAQPGLFLGKLFNVNSAVFAIALLMPVGFVSLLSPGRLAVGLPLFAVLCLSPITNKPYHHFHAPLVPIVIWSAAAGLGHVPGLWSTLRAKWRRGSRIEDRGSQVPVERRIPPAAIRAIQRSLPVVMEDGGWRMEDRDTGVAVGHLRSSILHPPSSTSLAATWAMTCSLATGLFISLSPLGITFWDPHSSGFWRRLYVPGPRAKLMPRVLAQIPTSSRVASTDFVHPRFTHHERSYDYSDYRPIVPNDTEYIVIDTQHPYSTIKRPDDVKELREQPDAWQLAPDETGGYFIVLKRKPR